MRVVMHREARAELRAASSWYGDVSEKLQSRFEAHITAAIDRIGAHPQQFPVIVENFRRMLVDIFPYEIFFEILPARVKILAISHSSRRPLYWIDRT